ncbi:hypothetical protein FEM48_Zijuj01G0142800 [Ziziphus jujuba var. spinosa]|uniref:Uncharacterized protein n=1 Tax=Ziziphus jujuba var. spinosa TaxID=714518 RepID=A0A978W1R6_ZIZJJ|nr:hypothetical protein FEM48_Zijuj01G0142800 [Ziziphus jujuba var. spinosa]
MIAPMVKVSFHFLSTLHLVNTNHAPPPTHPGQPVELDVNEWDEGVSVLTYSFKIVINTYFYVPSMEGCQVVLGVQWLQILKAIKIDYSKLTMPFNMRGQRHVLKGFTQGPPKKFYESELHSLEGDEYVLMHIAGNYEDTDLPTDIEELLSEFQQVFSKLSELPP